MSMGHCVEDVVFFITIGIPTTPPMRGNKDDKMKGALSCCKRGPITR